MEIERRRPISLPAGIDLQNHCSAEQFTGPGNEQAEGLSVLLGLFIISQRIGLFIAGDVPLPQSLFVHPAHYLPDQLKHLRCLFPI